jgi:hypothetical protein
MTAARHLPRCVALAVLSAVFVAGGLGAGKKSRVFNSRYETVWTAAVDVAKEGFLPDMTSREEGKLRFRTGPLRKYRFEVVIVDVGSGKTRADVELLTNLAQIEKDAWRSGDRYLTLLAQRLQQGGRK